MTAALAELQAWMQHSILAGAANGARAHIRGDNRLTAEARLGIYAKGYRLRLLDCLRAEYPVLAALAGPTAFDLFAQGYIAAHPSHSYTLYDYGAAFADWLEAARPAHSGAQDAEAIPAALARIERARAEVLRAHGVEAPAAAPDTTGADPLVAALLGFDSRCFRRPDSVRLLELAFDFAETLAAPRGAPPPLPQAVPTRIAIARAHYRAECHKLTDWQFDWLAALPAQGAPAPIGDARLAAWLPIAQAHGMIVATER